MYCVLRAVYYVLCAAGRELVKYCTWEGFTTHLGQQQPAIPHAESMLVEFYMCASLVVQWFVFKTTYLL